MNHQELRPPTRVTSKTFNGLDPMIFGESHVIDLKAVARKGSGSASKRAMKIASGDIDMSTPTGVRFSALERASPVGTPFLAMSLSSDGGTGTIQVEGIIGTDYGWWDDDAVGISSRRFKNELAALGKPSNIVVEINSPGGDPAAAIAMRTLLQGTGAKITTKVIGQALSAAFMLAMAGHERLTAKHALLMCHKASVQVFEAKTAKEMAPVVEALHVIDRNQAAILVETVPTLSPEEAEQLLDAETWMTGDEGVERGFFTGVIEGIQITACYAPTKMQFRNAPASLVIADRLPEVEPIETAPRPTTPEAPVIEEAPEVDAPSADALAALGARVDALATTMTTMVDKMTALGAPKAADPVVEVEPVVAQPPAVIAQALGRLDRADPTVAFLETYAKANGAGTAFEAAWALGADISRLKDITLDGVAVRATALSTAGAVDPEPALQRTTAARQELEPANYYAALNARK